MQSQECWELTFPRGQWEGSLDRQAGQALPSKVVTAMCWLCQKRDETWLWEKLPVILSLVQREGSSACLQGASMVQLPEALLNQLLSSLPAPREV